MLLPVSLQSLSRVQLFVTLLSMGFSRQECWSELPFPSLGDLPDPGIEPVSPAWQVGSLPPSHQGRPGSIACSIVLLTVYRVALAHLFIHSCVAEHLDCFWDHYEGSGSGHSCVSLRFHFFWMNTRSPLGEPYGSSVFNLIKNSSTIFQSDSPVCISFSGLLAQVTTMSVF